MEQVSRSSSLEVPSSLDKRCDLSMELEGVGISPSAAEDQSSHIYIRSCVNIETYRRVHSSCLTYQRPLEGQICVFLHAGEVRA